MIRAAHALGLGLLLAGCSASRIEHGTFYSAKGYQVTLPGDGWRIDPQGKADLALRRDAPPGGMLADATCEGKPLDYSLPRLARHLTFGLKNRVTVERNPEVLSGRSAEHTVVRGTVDGVEVAVEAVVVKSARCIHDFLYVAPLAQFEAGRHDFRAFVESFVMSCPSTTIVPPVGGSRRRMVRPAVDLPQPLSPTSPSVSPSLRERLMPSTAFTCATVRDRMPRPRDFTGKYFFRSVTRMISFAVTVIP